jgi:hypothetical protein
VLGELGFDAQVAVKIETRRAVDNIEELAQCGDYKKWKASSFRAGMEERFKKCEFLQLWPPVGGGCPAVLARVAP